MAEHTSLDDQLHWYKDAVIYELHIKAFRDSNKDGIGDFTGLMEKLNYLQELGVTAIWVLPFYPSPLRDDGYDIADYYTINPRYGTIEQFREFLAEAHKRKLKVITELVINHTSDQHPWFQRARHAPKGSPERNYYVWTDDPNQYKDVRIIFQDFESSNWTWDPVAQQYYWHRFFHHQPDLNFDNPAVQDEIFKIIDYWCALGVDAFRLDAVPYLFERENTNGENLPETHAFLKKLRKHIDEKYPTTAFLAEANMWPEDSASYFGDGDECHMNYHFPVMPRMFMSLQQEDRYPITDIFEQTPEIPPNCQWAIFLRNHDELTLEMVTDEERDFMYKVYAKDPKARINLGIRHRLAPLMDNDRNRIELMNSLLFSLPGTPVIYYGDEIGMGDNFYLGDRDGVRTPMQWSPDRNAGFSEANPQQLYLPVILDPEYHYEAVNVEMQKRNTSSLFWFMKRMISMRKNYKAFGRGDMKFIHVDNPKILAFTRTYGDETLLIISNLSKYAQPAEIDLRGFKGYYPVEMFSKNSFPVIREKEPYFFTLSPHSFQWYLLQKVKTSKDETSSIPELEISALEELTENGGSAQFTQEILPAFLKARTWFKGKKKKIDRITIHQQHRLPIKNRPVWHLILMVAYESGLPEYYQLAITESSGEESKNLLLQHGEAIIARLKTKDKESLLCDAFYIPAVQLHLVTDLMNNTTATGGTMQLKLKQEVIDFISRQNSLVPRIHSGDINNTSITYDNRYFLKMYRKVEAGINPDVELSEFLSEKAKWPHVPGYLGTIEWNDGNSSMVLGIMQVMIENHGDGRSYMLERLNNYMERILARSRSSMDPFERRGTLSEPLSFEELSPEIQVLIGNRSAEQARLMGIRTAEMHSLLFGEEGNKEFKPEEYSLHYQRSLFSSMQSLVRENYQSLEKNKSRLSPAVQQEVTLIEGKKAELLDLLKRIYHKKLDIWKIRIHGTFNLRKLLMTGKDIVIQDFGGNPFHSFSERKIKRSPVRDLAEMIISFYNTSYEAFYGNDQISKEELVNLLPFARQWAHYMSGFFLKGYIETVKGIPVIPTDRREFDIVLDTFVLERALIQLNYELNNRPDFVLAPLRIVKAIMGIEEAVPQPAYE